MSFNDFYDGTSVAISAFRSFDLKGVHMKNLGIKMLALSLLSTAALAQTVPTRRPLPPPPISKPSPIAKPAIVIAPSVNYPPVINPPVIDNSWSQRESLQTLQINQVLNGQGQILPLRSILNLQPGTAVKKVLVVALSRQGGGRLEILADGRQQLITSNGMQSYDKVVGVSLETIEAEVNLVVGQNLQTLQLRTTGSLLISLVGVTIENQGSYPQPVPMPMPIPLPHPGPSRPLPLPPVLLVCSQEAPNVFQATFQRVKSFAYSGSGLNLMSDAATAFAQEWTSRNPCSEADGFLRRINTLREFAYSGNGLNMNSDGARQFALENESRVCVEDNSFVKEFTQHKDFAYSGSGLNMSSQGARDYAWSKIQVRYFVCQR